MILLTKTKTGLRLLILGALVLALVTPRAAWAESQDEEYEGITDPFGDPTNYEFAQDEKEDKEFFHLGRFIMLGLNIGTGIYTGGLGRSTSPGLLLGGKLLYFFDRSLAFEAAFHYSSAVDTVRPNTTKYIEISTDLMPITGGFRYYFITTKAPKAIAAANPYLAFGGGIYLRSQTVTDAQGLNFGATQAQTSQFGFYAGAGVEFPIYHRHLYLGLDARYHFIFFPDEDDTFGGELEEGDRGGDYFAPMITITYSF